MKLISCRTLALALVAPAMVALFGCSTGPFATSKSDTSTAAVTPPAPAIVLPVAQGNNQPPAYPVTMLSTAKPGLVYVDCVVDETGRVLMAVVQNSTHPMFNKTTLEAVNGWTFKPGTKDGKPAAMRVVVPVEYVVKD